VITVSEHTTVIPGNEKILQVVARGNQVVLRAVAAGYSTVTVGDVIYKVTVFSDDSLLELREMVDEMLMNVEGVNVRGIADRIVVDGMVLTQEDFDRVQNIATTFEGLVVSMVEIDPKVVEKRPMFRLAFDFVEVDRDKAREYGMNLSGNLATMVFDWMDVIRNGPTVDLDGMVNFDATQAFTKVWESHEATVLAGEPVEYRYGGVILFPVQTATTVSMVEKEFGVTLQCTTRIDRRDNVEMELFYEVSDINAFENGTYILDVKSEDTTVLLKEGQSLALAGVVRHKSKRELRGLPWLVEIPVLGALFGSRKFEKGDTDGVVFITPYLIEPDGEENRDLIDRNIEQYREMKLLP
jgi:pilus assembly protein CpaC